MLSPNLDDLIRLAAHTISSTEAAAFSMTPPYGCESDLALVHHIRDDDSSVETRAQSVDALKKIIEPCVRHVRDGVIQINDSHADGTDQYCLVKLLMQQGSVVGATAFITRCTNTQHAQQQLAALNELLSGTTPASDPQRAPRLFQRLVRLLKRLVR